MSLSQSVLAILMGQRRMLKIVCPLFRSCGVHSGRPSDYELNKAKLLQFDVATKQQIRRVFLGVHGGVSSMVANDSIKTDCYDY
jgi:hypothetical protein